MYRVIMWFSRVLATLLRVFPYKSRFTILFAVFKAVDQSMDANNRWLTRKKIFDSYYPTWPVQSSDALARFYGFFLLLSKISDVPGDIVECGVGRGGSIIVICYAASLFGLDKVIYGFDSFAGFPSASANDLGERVTNLGEVSGWKDTSRQMILDTLEMDRSQNPMSLLRTNDVRVKLVSGFFNETLIHNLPEHIALLHVDCDLYDSTREVLLNCVPRMSPGGIMIFDEYDDVRWPGAKMATDEVCGAYGLSIEYLEMVQRYGVRFPVPNCLG
jgi:O-methyltransferase